SSASSVLHYAQIAYRHLSSPPFLFLCLPLPKRRTAYRPPALHFAFISAFFAARSFASHSFCLGTYTASNIR
ncbi:MAG: hypothetical protein J6V72_16855, partial [Kiritimatiellae bacterium]|nr:hypothetical protein [Kiritimatiellia bacterium]